MGIFLDIKVEKAKGNARLDTKVQEMGLCCPLSFFRTNIRETDSAAVLAKKAGVCVRTIMYHRAAWRSGKLKCKYRESCLRALWMSPNAIKKADAAEGEDKK